MDEAEIWPLEAEDRDSDRRAVEEEQEQADCKQIFHRQPLSEQN